MHGPSETISAPPLDRLVSSQEEQLLQTEKMSRQNSEYLTIEKCLSASEEVRRVSLADPQIPTETEQATGVNVQTSNYLRKSCVSDHSTEGSKPPGGQQVTHGDQLEKSQVLPYSCA